MCKQDIHKETHAKADCNKLMKNKKKKKCWKCIKWCIITCKGTLGCMEIVLIWKHGTWRNYSLPSKYQTILKITQKTTTTTTKKQRTVGHECYTCWKHASGKQWSKEEGTLKEFIANRLVVKEHLKQELKPKGNDKRKNCHELFYF
jgi:hypothetical protein